MLICSMYIRCRSPTMGNISRSVEETLRRQELSRFTLDRPKVDRTTQPSRGFSFGCDLVGWEKSFICQLGSGISAGEVKVVDSKSNSLVTRRESPQFAYLMTNEPWSVVASTSPSAFGMYTLANWSEVSTNTRVQSTISHGDLWETVYQLWPLRPVIERFVSGNQPLVGCYVISDWTARRRAWSGCQVVSELLRHVPMVLSESLIRSIWR